LRFRKDNQAHVTYRRNLCQRVVIILPVDRRSLFNGAPVFSNGRRVLLRMIVDNYFSGAGASGAGTGALFFSWASIAA
jgi:hypothetical protein